MKQLLLGVAILCGAALVAGCPVYSNDRYCNGNGCYDCPANSTPSSGTCIQWSCGNSSDCGPGYVCDPTYTCVPIPTAADAGCGTCPSGYACKLAGRVAQCVASGGTDAAAGDALTPDAGPIDGASDARAADAAATDGPLLPDSAIPLSDATAASDAPTDAARAPDVIDAGSLTACNGNVTCGLDGSKCIDGRCVPQAELCSDTTQCVVPGEACVDGVCVPHCNPTSPCPAGYACDFTKGVCDLNPDPCSGSGASKCVGGSACVEGRCVAPCAPGDAGGSCPSGQLCVNGGCIPDEAARFACKNDGQSGLLANECAASEICLHHDCYAACDPDGGMCANPGASCKDVIVTEGTYAICAAPSSLGSDCDPAIGKYCLGAAVCIDGFCK